MKIPNTPLFVKTHDFNVWLLNHTRRFPKHFRYSLTQRIENLALGFEQTLLQANGATRDIRKTLLQRADTELVCLRACLRYTLNFELLGRRQFEFASESLNELGRLLGGLAQGDKLITWFFSCVAWRFLEQQC